VGCDHRVGAATEVELKEKKHVLKTLFRQPVRQSKKYCSGGGVALLNAIPKVEALKFKDEDVQTVLI
jgi:chaperonin GroEL (HSP60 family)